MENLYITLIECDNTDAPNIGTIHGITDEVLKLKAIKSLESHFDSEVISLKIEDGLNFTDIRNSPPLDGFVELSDGYEARIELQQTFFY